MDHLPAATGTPPRRARCEPAAAAATGTARALQEHAHSANTRRAYRADWEQFVRFCQSTGLRALPALPGTVAAYIAAMAHTHAYSSIARRLSAIAKAHHLAGHAGWHASHPEIRTTLRGLARTQGRARRRSAALTTAELRRLVAACGEDSRGWRDRALLLVGFAGALRRSELVGIDREHISFDSSGLRLVIPRSKTDPEGQGAEIGISRGQRSTTCPVRALETWLRESACQAGPVFRRIDRWGSIEHDRLSPEAVRLILRRRAAEARLIVPTGERLSPHGLRAGFVTEAYRAGARDEEIMAHTRHADLKTMRGYVRRAKLMTESPTRLLGL